MRVKIRNQAQTENNKVVKFIFNCRKQKQVKNSDLILILLPFVILQFHSLLTRHHHCKRIENSDDQNECSFVKGALVFHPIFSFF